MIMKKKSIGGMSKNTSNGMSRFFLGLLVLAGSCYMTVQAAAPSPESDFERRERERWVTIESANGRVYHQRFNLRPLGILTDGDDLSADLKHTLSRYAKDVVEVFFDSFQGLIAHRFRFLNPARRAELQRLVATAPISQALRDQSRAAIDQEMAREAARNTERVQGASGRAHGTPVATTDRITIAENFDDVPFQNEYAFIGSRGTSGYQDLELLSSGPAAPAQEQISQARSIGARFRERDRERIRDFTGSLMQGVDFGPSRQQPMRGGAPIEGEIARAPLMEIDHSQVLDHTSGVELDQLMRQLAQERPQEIHYPERYEDFGLGSISPRAALRHAMGQVEQEREEARDRLTLHDYIHDHAHRAARMLLDDWTAQNLRPVQPRSVSLVNAPELSERFRLQGSRRQELLEAARNRIEAAVAAAEGEAVVLADAPVRRDQAAQAAQACSAGREYECAICLEDACVHRRALHDKHEFCADCLGQYLLKSLEVDPINGRLSDVKCPICRAMVPGEAALVALETVPPVALPVVSAMALAESLAPEAIDTGLHESAMPMPMDVDFVAMEVGNSAPSDHHVQAAASSEQVVEPVVAEAAREETPRERRERRAQAAMERMALAKSLASEDLDDVD